MAEDINAAVLAMDEEAQWRLLEVLQQALGAYPVPTLDVKPFLADVERDVWTAEGLPPGSVTREEAASALGYWADSYEFSANDYRDLEELVVERILEERDGEAAA